MSRPGRSQATRKQLTRERLSTAARELFEKHGYLGTTVDDIAARAGYTKGAFYGHFRDKADAFNTVLDDATGTSFSRLSQQLDDAGSEDAFGVVLEWFHDVFQDQTLARAQAEFYATAINVPRERRRLAARVTTMHRVVVEKIEQYCEAAAVQLPLPPTEVAAMIMAYVEGASRLQGLLTEPATQALVRDGLMYLWWGILGSAPPDAS